MYITFKIILKRQSSIKRRIKKHKPLYQIKLNSSQNQNLDSTIDQFEYQMYPHRVLNFFVYYLIFFVLVYQQIQLKE